MPYIKYQCVECGKQVSCHRSKKVIEVSGIPKFCSFGCRDGGLPGFSWKITSIEQIKKHLSILFEKKVTKSKGCWEWSGALDKDGYSILGVKNIKYRRAHRVSWFLHYGKMPNGICAHTCDNKFCTNPQHIFITDTKGNSNDLVQKGLQLKGEANGYSKLTENQVKEIKKMISDGAVCNHIAKLYEVNFSTIARIRDNKTWTHVPQPKEESQ